MSTKPQPARILVMETSALLAALTASSDSFTRSAQGLERLLHPSSATGQPLVDLVVIPDHVFYELTGLLPPCHAELLRRLAEAKAADETEHHAIAEAKRHLSPVQAALLKPRNHLESVIDFYTLISPRGEVNDAKRQQKNHLRVLLRFLAAHPESLQPTEVGRQYAGRLIADYSMLSARGNALKESLDQYRPTFADAFHYLENDFSLQELRVHAGQLMMMGLITEREFADRMGEDEKELGTKKRFYKTGDFINHLAATSKEASSAASADAGMPEEKSVPLITADERAALRSREKIDEPNGRYKDLTAGFFVDHPEILRRAHARVGTVPKPPLEPDAGAQEKAVQAARAALAPSPLLMEHYLSSGILPRDTASRLAIAHALGLSTHGLSSQSTDDRVREVLDPQGFEETSPTLPQLEAIREALRPLHGDLRLLDMLLENIRTNGNPASVAFARACRIGTAPQPKPSESAARTGLPYEKVYSDALSSGFIRWADFWQLAKPGLQPYGEYWGTEHADILVRPGLAANNATVYIAQDGIAGRQGITRFDTLDCKSVTLTPVNSHRLYYAIPIKELLARTHASLADSQQRSQLYRVFEGLLLPRVKDNAATLRRDALEVLGDTQTVHIEKDFANRWTRRCRGKQLPFEDPFTALHTNSRIQRKNLGEVSTLEAAEQALHAHPDAQVWLAGHDSDLYPSPLHDRAPQLEEAVVRQHAGMLNGQGTLDIRTLNQRAENKRLHFVTSPALVDTLRRLSGFEPRGRYEFIKLKEIIGAHPNDSWKRLTERTLGNHR